MHSIIKFDEMEAGTKDCLLAYAEKGIRPTDVIKSLLTREAGRLGFVLTTKPTKPHPRKNPEPKKPAA